MTAEKLLSKRMLEKVPYIEPHFRGLWRDYCKEVKALESQIECAVENVEGFKQRAESAESALREAPATHAEISELLKYFELNQKFPPESYAAKWDYNTALHIWVKYDHTGLVKYCTKADAEGEKPK